MDYQLTIEEDKTSTSVVQESPSRLRTWLSNKNLQYDFVMSIILIILNVTAIIYLTQHKIYFFSSCVYWSIAITNVEASDLYMTGRISHIGGLGILLTLLYSISPRLALWFGLPSSLWVLAAFIAPLYTFCLAPALKEVSEDTRAYWKFINEPQVRVVNV
ncbi:hypothetical protein EUTSA_v10012097mg [Eutrema salsugineum]|uniref:Uncharacterized protein n=1 Tax=Eutrema salsugineum TaxID=72664 RepID=V4KHK1_EUTSA|nr:hypothetical protein EUTSA_v10012097mg [Eutrema salsugineum]